MNCRVGYGPELVRVPVTARARRRESQANSSGSEVLASAQGARLAALAALMREWGKVPDKSLAEQVILALCLQPWQTLRTYIPHRIWPNPRHF